MKKKQIKVKKVKGWISRSGGIERDIVLSQPLQMIQRIPRFEQSGDVIIRWFPCEITYKI